MSNKTFRRVKFVRADLGYDDKLLAVKLWQSGKDTHDIAKSLNVPESTIYNGLPQWRVAVEMAA